MANTREIIRRQKTVASIVRITKTMEMVSTSQFRHVYKRMMRARPYRDQITRLLEEMQQLGVGQDMALLQDNQGVKTAALLVFTSNRGLCGGFNSGLFRLVEQERAALIEKEFEVHSYVCGKKGVGHFRFHQLPMTAGYTDIDQQSSYAKIEGLADFFIKAYSQKKFASVRVIYTRFVSNASQVPDVYELLPLGKVSQESEDAERHGSHPAIKDCDFSPSAEDLLTELVPTAVRAQLYQCFLDSIVSEQAARMTAMSAATSNGRQMIDALTQQYNRVRQSQITGELLDIMGGVEALKKA